MEPGSAVAQDEQAQQPGAVRTGDNLAPRGTPLSGATLPDGTRPLMHGLARAFRAYKQIYEGDYGPWRTLASRYQRWRRDGAWARIVRCLQALETDGTVRGRPPAAAGAWSGA